MCWGRVIGSRQGAILRHFETFLSRLPTFHNSFREAEDAGPETENTGPFDGAILHGKPGRFG